MPLPQPPSDAGDGDRRSPLPPPPPSAAVGGATSAVCYRHPDRAVGRRCTRCGKPACGECLQSASVGSHCLDCVKAARPDMATRAKYWSAKQPAFVTYALIAINLAVFIGLGLWYDLAGMLSGSITDAHVNYALSPIFLDGDPKAIDLGREVIFTEGNEWYRVVTSGFLHFGLIHLAFNMYFLYILGGQMEPQLGRVRFVALYFASLLGGSAGVLAIDQGGFTAGASGAVFGLLGATAVGMYQNGINPLRTQIGTLLMINLGLTFFVSGISIGGHVGGLIAGAICGFVMLAPGYKGFPDWSRIATPVAVGAASIALSIVFVG
ncbi:MAG: rhomboid family intramembrane serine protease [Ilumatobacter sp.]